MDLFDRAEDEPNAIKRGARYYYATASRLAWSAGHGLSTYLWQEGTAEFWQLASADNLWGFCLVAAGFFLVSSVPVLGPAVNLYLSYYGLKDVWERLRRAGQALDGWYQAAHQARTHAELEASSLLFAKGVAAGGLVVIEAVVSKGSFKLLGRLLRKFPVPAWFRALTEKARKKREERRNSEPSRSQGVNSPLRGRDFAPLLLPAEGAKRVAEEFPVGPVVAGAAALAALMGGLWWGVSASERKR